VQRGGVEDRVDVELVTADWAPPPRSYDGVLVADVLYLLGTDAAVAMVERAAQAVRPGGRVVIKEMNAQPRWKARLNAAQEHLSVRVLGITEGDVIESPPVPSLVDALEAMGLVTTVHRIDRWYPHPHVVVTGDRPT
jgi:hypothetical protein